MFIKNTRILKVGLETKEGLCFNENFIQQRSWPIRNCWFCGRKGERAKNDAKRDRLGELGRRN